MNYISTVSTSLTPETIVGISRSTSWADGVSAGRYKWTLRSPTTNSGSTNMARRSRTSHMSTKKVVAPCSGYGFCSSRSINGTDDVYDVALDDTRIDRRTRTSMASHRCRVFHPSTGERYCRDATVVRRSSVTDGARTRDVDGVKTTARRRQMPTSSVTARYS